MLNKGQGQLFVVSSASGAGKTTLCRRLKEEFDALRLSISYTTRAPRGTEQNGREYQFVDIAEFKTMIERGELAEYARVHDNFYGTSVATVESARASGDDLLFDIDVQGARQLKDKFPDAVTLVFVLPPSLAELERRLRGRGTDRPEVIDRRLAVAKAEMSHYVSYDYVVVNDELDAAYDQLRSIYQAMHLRRASMDQVARSILAGTAG